MSTPSTRICALVAVGEAGDHHQRRGLAGAGGPEQREELAGADAGADAVDDAVRAVALGDLAQLDAPPFAAAPGEVRRRRSPETHFDQALLTWSRLSSHQLMSWWKPFELVHGVLVAGSSRSFDGRAYALVLTGIALYLAS